MRIGVSRGATQQLRLGLVFCSHLSHLHLKRHKKFCAAQGALRKGNAALNRSGAFAHLHSGQGTERCHVSSRGAWIGINSVVITERKGPRSRKLRARAKRSCEHKAHRQMTRLYRRAVGRRKETVRWIAGKQLNSCHLQWQTRVDDCIAPCRAVGYACKPGLAASYLPTLPSRRSSLLSAPWQPLMAGMQSRR